MPFLYDATLLLSQQQAIHMCHRLRKCSSCVGWGCCAILLHTEDISTCELSLEWVCRIAARASQRWCPQALHVSSVLWCSRHFWLSSQLSFSRIWPGRNWKSLVLTCTHKPSDQKCYSGCKNILRLQIGGYQLRTEWQRESHESSRKQSQMVMPPPLSLMAGWSE